MLIWAVFPTGRSLNKFAVFALFWGYEAFADKDIAGSVIIRDAYCYDGLLTEGLPGPDVVRSRWPGVVQEEEARQTA